MDRDTFDRLLLDHLPGATRFAVRLTGEAVSAEDLLHDALVRAASAWRTFRGESSFKTWFFQIMVNAFRDRLRRCGEPAVPLPETLADRSAAADPARVAANAEFSRRVATLVSSLPPRQREVLVLVAYESLAPVEAARVLGISEQNARTTLHLARQKLKQQLAPYLGEREDARKVEGEPEREREPRSIPTE